MLIQSPPSASPFPPSPPPQAFTIDGSGVIRTRRELDREVRELYQLVVEVRDHGEEPLAATTSLEVMVLDEIDYSPVFSQVSRQLLHLLVCFR